MVLSYPAEAGDQVRPVPCRCGGQHFHRHGSYWRKIAQAWVQRFICTMCAVTTSMVPDNCVPYKHHPTELINDTVHGLLHGRSGRDYQCEVHHSTACRWRQEFSSHASVLATEGAQRLGMAPISGSPQHIYQQLRGQFSALGANGFFRALQVRLCSQRPGIGIFRVLIF